MHLDRALCGTVILWTNLSGREHCWWVMEGTKLCGFIELFNSSKQMTRRGRYVQRGWYPLVLQTAVSSRYLSYTHTQLPILAASVEVMVQDMASGWQSLTWYKTLPWSCTVDSCQAALLGHLLHNTHGPPWQLNQHPTVVAATHTYVVLAVGFCTS